MLSRSTFCGVVPGWGDGSCLEPSVSLLGASPRVGVMPGWGWSGRFEDAVLHGCIPVLLQVHVCLDQLHGGWRASPFLPEDGIHTEAVPFISHDQ